MSMLDAAEADPPSRERIAVQCLTRNRLYDAPAVSPTHFHRRHDRLFGEPAGLASTVLGRAKLVIGQHLNDAAA